MQHYKMQFARAQESNKCCKFVESSHGDKYALCQAGFALTFEHRRHVLKKQKISRTFDEHILFCNEKVLRNRVTKRCLQREKAFFARSFEFSCNLRPLLWAVFHHANSFQVIALNHEGGMRRVDYLSGL